MIATGLLLLLVAVLIERALSLIHHTALLFSLGGLLAYAVDPIVEWVRGRHLPAKGGVPRRQAPRWLGVVAVFATVSLAFGLTIFLVGQGVVRQTQGLIRDQDKLRIQATQKVAEAESFLHKHGVQVDLTDTLKNPPDSVKKWEGEAERLSLNFASDFSRGAAEGIVVILISIYLLLFSEELRHRTTGLFAAHVRPYISDWQDDVNRILGGFVRGQAILALALGLGAMVACGVLELRFWLLIGVFVAIVSLIPVIGPYIGAVPAILSAVLTQHSWVGSPVVRVVLVLVLFIAMNEFGSKVIYPRLVGKALGLHEVVVLFALLAGLEVGGIVGTLFAAPLLALAIATVHQLYRLWLGTASASGTAVTVTATTGSASSVGAGVVIDPAHVGSSQPATVVAIPVDSAPVSSAAPTEPTFPVGGVVPTPTVPDQAESPSAYEMAEDAT